MSVVEAVAKGNMSSIGSITGEQASEALSGYLGYSPVEAGRVDTSAQGSIPSAPIPQGDVITLDGGAAAAAYSASASTSRPDGHTTIPPSSPADGSTHIPNAPPQFRDVEIGGGRITGHEVSSDGQAEREFAMYSAEQYMAPTGPYDTVQTVDGSSWYRQYAQPTVEKTPYKDHDDKIKYEERIVSQMPPVPKRKDKI